MDHKITFYRSTGAPPTQRHYGFAAWAVGRRRRVGRVETQRHYGFAAWALSHWASDWAPSRYLDPVSVHTHEAG
jgi:hypothetical protein